MKPPDNKPFRPTPQQLREAFGKTVPDVIAPDLRVLFCGINPGLYTAAVGHHFARPGNRFWPALHLGGFTDRIISPFDELELLQQGWGITNVVARATAGATELRPAEYAAGGRILEKKLRKFRPQVLAVLGVGAYRLAFNAPEASIGPQPEKIADTRLWVLPNPSGLNAHYDVRALGRLFAELRKAIDAAG